MPVGTKRTHGGKRSPGPRPSDHALLTIRKLFGLEINLLFREVRDDVLTMTGKRQEPFTYGSLPSEAFYFRRP